MITTEEALVVTLQTKDKICDHQAIQFLLQTEKEQTAVEKTNDNLRRANFNAVHADLDDEILERLIVNTDDAIESCRRHIPKNTSPLITHHGWNQSWNYNLRRANFNAMNADLDDATYLNLNLNVPLSILMPPFNLVGDTSPRNTSPSITHHGSTMMSSSPSQDVREPMMQEKRTTLTKPVLNTSLLDDYSKKSSEASQTQQGNKCFKIMQNYS